MNEQTSRDGCRLTYCRSLSYTPTYIHTCTYSRTSQGTPFSFVESSRPYLHKFGNFIRPSRRLGGIVTNCWLTPDQSFVVTGKWGRRRAKKKVMFLSLLKGSTKTQQRLRCAVDVYHVYDVPHFSQPTPTPPIIYITKSTLHPLLLVFSSWTGTNY